MVRSAASRRVAAAAAALAVGLLGGGPASAGGLLFYEFGTAEVGLAAAGYAARAQDASTAFTNPAAVSIVFARLPSNSPNPAKQPLCRRFRTRPTPR